MEFLIFGYLSNLIKLPLAAWSKKGLRGSKALIRSEKQIGAVVLRLIRRPLQYCGWKAGGAAASAGPAFFVLPIERQNCNHLVPGCSTAPHAAVPVCPPPGCSTFALHRGAASSSTLLPQRRRLPLQALHPLQQRRQVHLAAAGPRPGPRTWIETETRT